KTKEWAKRREPTLTKQDFRSKARVSACINRSKEIVELYFFAHLKVCYGNTPRCATVTQQKAARKGVLLLLNVPKCTRYKNMKTEKDALHCLKGYGNIKVYCPICDATNILLFQRPEKYNLHVPMYMLRAKRIHNATKFHPSRIYATLH
ncbi:Hypothetical predicted protein, partial [Paramuricea clavata]